MGADQLSRFFDEHATIAFPTEHDQHLDTLATTLPSPWRDNGRKRWLVTDPKQAHQILTSRAFTNDLTLAGAESGSTLLQRRISPEPPSILFTEGELHQVLRRPLAQRYRAPERDVDAFAARVAERLIAATADGASFDLGAIVFDALAETTLPIFDITEPNRHLVVKYVFAINKLFDLGCDASEHAEGNEARARLREALRQAFVGGSAGVSATWSTAGVPIDAQISSAEFAIRAAIVTAGTLLLNAVVLLLVFDETAEAFYERGVDSVDELLARAASALDTGRIALADTVVGDATIRAGETVICLLAVAGRRDGRGFPRSLFVFGAGRHRCVGMYAVRAELEAMLDLLRGIDRLTIDRPPVLQTTPSFRGVRELWVSASR